MNNIKKIVIILIIIVIVIISLLAGFMIINKKNENEEQEIDNKEIEESFENNNKLEKLNDLNDYIFLKECINKYINYSLNISDSMEEDDERYKEQAIIQLKSIVPDFVIEELNISDNNIYEKIGIEDKIFRINNVYKSLQTVNMEAYEESTSIYAYYVEGTLIDRKNYNKNDFSIIIILDKINATFLIIPEKYLETKKIKLTEDEAISIYTAESIKNNYYNIFDLKVISDEEKCGSYFTDFKNNMIYDSEYIYNYLDNEYSKVKFENIEEFKKYINQNYNNIQMAKMEKYSVNRSEEFTQYICEDQNGEIYIFNENKLFEYNIILDKYTIDLEQFLDKYNKSNDKTKAGMNIEKILEAINHKDYKYVYNKLNDTFRNNNFSDINKFETFIKTKFFNKNDIEYLDVNSEANAYIFSVRIKNIEDESMWNDLKIIVRLNTGTDFIISFNI